MSQDDAETFDGENKDFQRKSRQRLAASRKAAPDAGPSQPQFSQPVRQIVLMLIVMGLAAVGGWFAYGSILSIFSANRFLNGLILAVFALGVLTCLWQVAQLINSVSWIERFATRRRNALESGISASPQVETDNAPRLLAPLAALLGTRGPVGGVISTGSARSILDSVGQRVDEARDITRYLTSLLIFLGLLGTFYGLATTIPAIVDTIRTLSPKEGQTSIDVFAQLMNGLEAQLGGMATAFSSSLLGLAGSLVVGLLELFVTHGQNRFYRELEEWLTSFTRIGMAGGESEGGVDQATIAGFLDQVALQMGQLQEFYARRDERRDAEAQAADDRAMAMAQGVERLTNHILADSEVTVARAAALTKALNRLADGQEQLIAQGQQAPEADDGGEARMRLRSIDVQLGRLVEESSSSNARMVAELRQDLAALTAAIQRMERRDGA